MNKKYLFLLIGTSIIALLLATDLLAPTISVNYPNSTVHENETLIFNISVVDDLILDTCTYSLDNNSNLSMERDLYEGQYSNISFDISATGNSNPSGIALNGTYLWITDLTDARVYQYWMNGTSTGESFGTGGSGNHEPYGITHNNTYFWITDLNDSKVYQYWMNGTSTGESFSTVTVGSSYPLGLTNNGTYFWIADLYGDIDKFWMNGTSTGESFETVLGFSFTFIGVETNNTWIWINQKGDVYKHYMNGTYTGYKFSIEETGSVNNFEVKVNGTYFYAVDSTLADVYLFNQLSNPYVTATNTSMTEGDHNVSFYCNDSEGNLNSTTQNFEVDYQSPSISIFLPESTTYANNESLSLNYTISDQSDISSCWYKVINSTSNLIIDNQSIVDCLNTTFNVPRSDSYTLTLYANDSLGKVGFSSVEFSVSLESPVIVINSPLESSYLDNTKNVNFSFTVTDSDGIDTCQLWSNFTGSWELNESFSSVSSGVQFSTFKNLSENVKYNFNLWCNDSIGNSDFYFENYTFIIDETFPLININSVSTTQGLQTFIFNSTVTDENIGTCKYSIYNSTGDIDGSNENVSFTCNTLKSATTTNYGSFTLKVYSTDLAGNENSTNLTFLLTESTIEIISGGGGTTIITEAANWTMEVSEGTKRYDVLLISGTARELAFNLENTGEENLTVTFSCVDLENNFCQYVNFTRESISLPPIKDVKTTAFFTITLPDTIDKEDAIFNIIGLDQNNQQNSITVDVSVGTQNFIVETLAKLGLKTKGGFPYIAIFLIPLVILFPLSIRFIKEDTPLRGLWIVLIGIGIPFLLVYLF